MRGLTLCGLALWRPGLCGSGYAGLGFVGPAMWVWLCEGWVLCKLPFGAPNRRLCVRLGGSCLFVCQRLSGFGALGLPFGVPLCLPFGFWLWMPLCLPAALHISVAGSAFWCADLLPGGWLSYVRCGPQGPEPAAFIGSC